MIQVSGVYHHFGLRPILHDISFSVEAGRTLAIIGPNGMGKTTLLNIMAGVASPAEGTVLINGRQRRSTVEDELAIRQKTLFLPPDLWFPSGITGRNLVLGVGEVWGVPARRLFEHAERLLKVFQLDRIADSAVSGYSTGQKKKVGLCSALISEASILLLDEPFSGGLDQRCWRYDFGSSSAKTHLPRNRKPTTRLFCSGEYRMNRWYRQVMPRRSHVLLFALLLILLDSTTGAIWLAWGKWLIEAQGTGVVRVMLHASQVLCGMAVLLVALRRVHQFPPANPSYTQWLATTPWASHQRLPFGPWQPVIQDTIPLGVLGVISAFHGVFTFRLPPDRVVSLSASAFSPEWWWLLCVAVLLPALVFFGVWVIAGFCAVMPHWKRSAFVLLFVIGVVIHLGIRLGLPEATAVAAVCAVVGFVLVYKKMQRMVRTLPQVMNETQHVKIEGKMVPAFEMLSPRPYRNRVIRLLENTRPRALEFCLLLFVWLTLPPWEGEFVLFAGAFACGLSLARVAVYAGRTSSHLGLLSRWHSRRFIVPQYDRVWLPSLAMVFVASVPVLLAITNMISPQLAGPLAVVLPILVGWICGPDYEQWSLTAPVEYLLRAAILK